MTMLKNILLALTVVAVAALISCSNDHGTEPAPFDLDAPPTPTGLSVTPGSEQATITWDYPAEDMATLKEFRIYYYFPAYDVVELAGTATAMTYVDTKLVGNVEYCYKVSAVDTFGIEGWRSGEGCVVINTR
jgi:hypothetical protein